MGAPEGTAAQQANGVSAAADSVVLDLAEVLEEDAEAGEDDDDDDADDDFDLGDLFGGLPVAADAGGVEASGMSPGDAG